MDDEWLFHRAAGRKYGDSISPALKVQSRHLAWNEYSRWVDECPPKTPVYPEPVNYSETEFLQMPSRCDEVTLD